MANTCIADGVLIKRYVEGNTAAFEILVNRHKDRIYGSVMNIVNDSYLAEDIFQETFIKIIHNIKRGKYNHEDKFLPWALRIARNMAIDSLRRKKRMPTVVTSDGSDLFEGPPLSKFQRMYQQLDSHLQAAGSPDSESEPTH